MTITFKPLNHKKEVWNEKDLKIKLETLFKGLSGRKVCLKRNFSLKKANFLQRMIWPLVLHSKSLRKWFLGIDTRSNQVLFQRIGNLIRTKIELENDAGLILAYNRSLNQYSTYLETIDRKAAVKYSVKNFVLKTTESVQLSTLVKNELLVYMYAQKNKDGLYYSDIQFKKVVNDFDAAANLDDFCFKLAEGDAAFLAQDIASIRKFIVNATEPISSSSPQQTYSSFTGIQKPLFKYLEENKRMFGKTDGERKSHLAKIKNAYKNARNEKEFFSLISLHPTLLSTAHVKKISDFISTLLNPSPPGNSSKFTSIEDRLFPSIQQRYLKKDSNLYPKQFLTEQLGNTQRAPFLVNLHTSYNGFEIPSINEYMSIFRETFERPLLLTSKTSLECNLHDFQFQNFALKLLKGINYKKIQNYQNLDQSYSASEKAACLQLVRARNYAIASRSDIDWQGNFIYRDKDITKKMAQLQANWNSLVLYDWAGVPEEEFDKKTGNEKTQISIAEEATFTAVERMAMKYNPMKLAWVSLANAHRPGGDYQNGGRDEESMTATNSDAIVVLSHAAQLCPKTGQAEYKKNFHIPPGGNYFHQTAVFTNATQPIICNSIVHAYADFSIKKNQPNEESEFIDYKDGNHLNVTSKRYVERIRLDMKGILRTAKKHGQEVLILNASGSEKLGHDLNVEAKTWAAVLNEPEFFGHFKEVIFVINEETNSSEHLNNFKKVFSH